MNDSDEDCDSVDELVESPARSVSGFEESLEEDNPEDFRTDLGIDIPRSPETGRSWRFSFISVFIMLGWAVLVTRLIQLQGAQWQLMNARVTRQSIFSEVIPARPGEILDRNGQVLAMTIPCDSFFAVPEEIEDPLDFAWRVGPILEQIKRLLKIGLVDHETLQPNSGMQLVLQ